MKLQSKILINCSNLHHGGGVAVAASFLSSLCRQHRAEQFSVLVSNLVHQNLLGLGITADQFGSYVVQDYVGIQSLWKGLDRYFSGYQIVFTVFGPAYFLHKRTRHVVGFAQASIVYPGNKFEKTLPVLNRIKLRLKYFLQALFFRRADELIVELDHVKTGLLKQRLFTKMPIHVVNNAIDEIYRDSTRWQMVRMPFNKNRMKFGVASKNFPHKNLRCFPKVKEILLKEYLIDADFFVTFSENEWSKCDDHFRQSIINVGTLSLAQCPSFYNALDGVVFPSLLECFSATPIEAMQMKKPLFASDLPFIVDCCHKHANYFDPLQPEQIAKSIYTYFQQSETERNAFVNSAYLFVQTYPDAQARANKYIDILLNSIASN